MAAGHSRPHRGRPQLGTIPERPIATWSLSSPTRSALNAAGETPAWAAKRHAPVPAKLIADVQVWRAATQVDSSDPATQPGHLSSATPPESGNSNSTRDSHPRIPIQIGNRGGCSPQKSLE